MLIFSKEQQELVITMINYLEKVLVPLEESIKFYKKTNGLNDVLMRIPILWLRSLLDRLYDIEVGKEINMTRAEVEIVIDLLRYLEFSKVIAGDKKLNNLLTSLLGANTSHTKISI
jgi:hypothetical protein